MCPASSEVECERGEKASSGRCWAEVEKGSCIKEQEEGRSRRKKMRRKGRNEGCANTSPKDCRYRLLPTVLAKAIDYLSPLLAYIPNVFSGTSPETSVFPADP